MQADLLAQCDPPCAIPHEHAAATIRSLHLYITIVDDNFICTPATGPLSLEKIVRIIFKFL